MSAAETILSPEDAARRSVGFGPAPCSASFRGVSIINSDCMRVMSKLADKAYDIALCDPPYGIKADANAYKNGVNCKANGFKEHKNTNWDSEIPEADYFAELRRVSKNQIICGANYMTEHLPPSMGWVFWYKMQDNFSFSDGEFIYTSFNQKARIFQYARGMESGFAPAGNTGGSQNIHPTQKPVALYKWLLTKFAKPGDRILDTHMGSGSSVIAALEFGYEMLACEIDEHYFAAAVERIGRYEQQGTFDMTPNDQALRQPPKAAVERKGNDEIQ